MSSPRQTFSGGCQCGAVHYEVVGRAINLFCCHCTQCQKQSSSAFAMALWVAEFEVRECTGETVDWTRTTPSGQALTGRFCAVCGTRVLHHQARHPEFISIKPGSLDDIGNLVPVAHIWTSEAQPWFKFPEDMQTFAGNPPSFETLISQFSEQNFSA